MIISLATLALGSFLGIWTYYARDEAIEEAQRADCGKCPFFKDGCCVHILWTPSMCMIAPKKT